MRHINPVYIGLFLISVLALLLISLNSAKNDLEKSKKVFLETSKIAMELNALKQTYLKNKYLEKNIKEVLSQKILKKANINAEFKKNYLYLKSKKMDKKALNFLMNKILNNTYNVTAMKIKKIDKSNVSFEMEIKW